jgi:hypothetical protein
MPAELLATVAIIDANSRYAIERLPEVRLKISLRD